MLLKIKEERIHKRGKRSKSYLIRCDTCDKERWYLGKDCNHGRRKFCSRSCINKGRSHSDEWKLWLSEKNSGSHNPFYGQKHSKETRKKMSASHLGAKTFWDIKKECLSEDEYKKWYESYCQARMGEGNAFFGKKHTAKTRRHLSEIKAKLISESKIDLMPSHYGLKGYYASTKMGETFRHDSLIELLRMRILDLDDSVLSWTKRHSIRIKYQFDDNLKTYVPDFLIYMKNGNRVLEEVKGYENERKKEAKFTALREYCKSQKLVCNILTYDDIDMLCNQWFNKRINVLRKEYHKERNG